MATLKLKEGARYQPQEAVNEGRLPEKWANDPFVHVHYPTGWAWDDEVGDFLPVLSRIFQTRGVNGVGDDGKMNRALGGSMAKGGTVIDPRNPRLGEWANYVIRYPTAGGHFHYCFVGTEFEVLPNGEAAIVDASESYRAFCRHLVTVGLIDPVPAMVVNRIVEIERQGLERLIRAAQNNPHRADDVKAKRERIARIQAWRTKGTEEAPKATRTRLGKAATAPALDMTATAPEGA